MIVLLVASFGCEEIAAGVAIAPPASLTLADVAVVHIAIVFVGIVIVIAELSVEVMLKPAIVTLG